MLCLCSAQRQCRQPECGSAGLSLGRRRLNLIASRLRLTLIDQPKKKRGEKRKERAIDSPSCQWAGRGGDLTLDTVFRFQYCDTAPRCAPPYNADDARAAATALGFELGGRGYPFAGTHDCKGLYAYTSGAYTGLAFFGLDGRYMCSGHCIYIQPWAMSPPFPLLPHAPSRFL